MRWKNAGPNHHCELWNTIDPCIQLRLSVTSGTCKNYPKDFFKKKNLSFKSGKWTKNKTPQKRFKNKKLQNICVESPKSSVAQTFLEKKRKKTALFTWNFSPAFFLGCAAF